ncbi:heterokaryon incompatibility protein-domain-containing protein [Nemania sp. FL0031]|nr:heterokaryon incompatibility protein-domain-containing protein [Nemania sp. FL0031]
MHGNDSPKNEFRYLPLRGPGTIRLLRLTPRQDTVARIECQLFDYPLVESTHTVHLYEALSYVWGSEDGCYSISVNGRDLSITENLHTALVELRDWHIERVLWIDAICINQKDDSEKEEQIKLMASIFSKASRVIVWLGPGVDGGDQALEDIRRTADDTSTEPVAGSSTSQQTILALLRRPWFERIWVLQEVAAAQSILIKCGSVAINGYAFSVGLNSKTLDSIYEASPDLRSLLRPVAYLMRNTVFRQGKPPSFSGDISLPMRPIGELIGMYHTRKSTILHDKVFALLGMSSDKVALHLPLNYKVGWDDLLMRLVEFILGNEVSVRTWPSLEMAEIQGKGSVLGKVASIKPSDRDEQQVIVLLRNKSGNLEHELNWILPPSAKPVRVGDLVCSLQGAAKPTITRIYKDYLSIIMITTPLLELLQPVTKYPLNFLLFWDWGKMPREARNQEHDGTLEYRIPIFSKDVPGQGQETSTREWDMISILEDGEEYWEAEKRVEKIRKVSESKFGEGDQRTLVAMNRLALIHEKAKRWDEARTILEQELKIRLLVQGTHHPDTAETRKRLASTFEKQGHLHPSKLKVILSILEEEDSSLQLRAIEVAGSLDEEVMRLLLSGYGYGVVITEDVVIVAAGNELRGAQVIQLLLDHRGDEVHITERVLAAAVGNKVQGEKILGILLDQRASEVKITENVINAIRRNRPQRVKITDLLLKRCEGELAGRITHVSNELILSLERPTVGRAHTSRKWGCELLTLSPPARNWELVHGMPTVDLVAVHEIGGDLLGSWTNELSGLLWFNELLMPALPRTRVMTFGYKADLPSCDVETLKNLANTLLALLRDHRSDGGDAPIVFVGHGVGGLIIKQALASSHHGNDDGEISHWTRSVIFFGTPHRGMGSDQEASLSPKIRRTALSQTIPSSKPLTRNSLYLESLMELFQLAANNYEILSLCETRPEPGRTSLIVDKLSASMRLPNETILDVDATHSEMCKFSNEFDPSFMMVKRIMRRAATSKKGQ